MLTAQAHTLDAIFNKLALLAINTKYMDELEPYLKLALRAQSQCRTTWAVLATIKNPPVMGYVRQANVPHRPQQVNNVSRAGKSQSVKQTIGGERWRTAGVRSGGRAYCRVSAASDGLRQFLEHLQDSSFRLRSYFRTRRPHGRIHTSIEDMYTLLARTRTPILRPIGL